MSRKSFFFLLNRWFDNGIVFVAQLFNEDGLLYTYEEFLAHYKIPVTPGAYARVFGAISSKVCMLFRQGKIIDIQHWSPPTIVNSYVGHICFSFNSRNKFIRELLKGTLYLCLIFIRIGIV